MSEFLELNKPQKFWKLLLEQAEVSPRIPEDTIVVDFENALDYILAEDLIAPESLPPFDRSIVDGFAVKAEDTAGASSSMPLYLDIIGEIEMGTKTDLSLESGQAVSIPTGAVLPQSADAVIMVEYTEVVDDDTIEVVQAVGTGENIVQKGEDIEKGEELLMAGNRLRPQDIGALAGLGITEVPVFRKPEIAVISTGNELVPPTVNPDSGCIRDINTYSISSVISKVGGCPFKTGIIRDNFNELRAAVTDNLEKDLVLISGGSSVGIKDLTIDLLDSLGEPGVLLHGLSLKPGKPTILAVIEGTPVIGLPGHPASAWTVTHKIILPIVESLMGVRNLSQATAARNNRKNNNQNKLIREQAKIITAVLNRNLDSDKGREEYIPVKLSKKRKSERYIADSIRGKSSLITTLVEADGLIKIDSFQEGLPQNTLIEVRLF